MIFTTDGPIVSMCGWEDFLLWIESDALCGATNSGKSKKIFFNFFYFLSNSNLEPFLCFSLYDVTRLIVIFSLELFNLFIL
jgi:hypothetical protein